MHKLKLATTTLLGLIVASVCPVGLAQTAYLPQSTLLPKPATTWIASPNYNNRTAPYIDSIIIHTTEETLSDTIDIFLDPAREVSAHFVIASNGDIYQMVDTQKRAWHATYYNHRSIGIEMVGYANQRSTWNAENLGSLTDLLAWLLQAYPEIPLTHPQGDAYDYPNDSFAATGLIAHGQVQPWNRSDPGPYFPWAKIIADVDARLASVVPEPNTAALVIFGAMASGCRTFWRGQRWSTLIGHQN